MENAAFVPSIMLIGSMVAIFVLVTLGGITLRAIEKHVGHGGDSNDH